LTNTLTSGGDGIVANGIAFNREGDLFIADTARGAIWRARFGSDGSLLSPVGCDSTFAPDTLCLSKVYVAHPMLEGVDGIALDAAGNVWGTANARQAVVVVAHNGGVQEIFRNPVNGSTGLRNAGDRSVGNNHVLEFPASPYLLGNLFCTSNFDSNSPGARDNSPANAGEINPYVGLYDGRPRGKISCLDQRLMIPGLPLPLQ
jgi:sugar lactone lactonase YvrE